MMSPTSKRELLKAIRPRYTLGRRPAKERILDEFVAATGYHRKYAIHLLNHPPPRRVAKRRPRRSKYGGRVQAARAEKNLPLFSTMEEAVRALVVSHQQSHYLQKKEKIRGPAH